MVAYQATGVMPQQLKEAQEIPQLAQHVWYYFLELHAERGNNGMAPMRITSTGIKDWCFVSGIRLERWEIKAIRRIDSAWITSND